MQIKHVHQRYNEDLCYNNCKILVAFATCVLNRQYVMTHCTCCLSHTIMRKVKHILVCKNINTCTLSYSMYKDPLQTWN